MEKENYIGAYEKGHAAGYKIADDAAPLGDYRIAMYRVDDIQACFADENLRGDEFVEYESGYNDGYEERFNRENEANLALEMDAACPHFPGDDNEDDHTFIDEMTDEELLEELTEIHGDDGKQLSIDEIQGLLDDKLGVAVEGYRIQSVHTLIHNPSDDVHPCDGK